MAVLRLFSQLLVLRLCYYTFGCWEIKFYAEIISGNICITFSVFQGEAQDNNMANSIGGEQ